MSVGFVIRFSNKHGPALEFGGQRGGDRAGQRIEQGRWPERIKPADIKRSYALCDELSVFRFARKNCNP